MKNEEIEQRLNTASVFNFIQNERTKWCIEIITKDEEECRVFKALTEYITFMQNHDDSVDDNLIETSLIHQIIKAIEKLGDKQRKVDISQNK